jgi:methylated-DNA-protein-cysteine methyltransferase-like protein
MGPRRLSTLHSKVYALVTEIPKGRVASYGQVAALAGLPRRARLVGQALRALPEGSEVPWHRVVNASGAISLPAENGQAGYQRFLLEKEGVRFDARGRIDLAKYRWEPASRPSGTRRRPDTRTGVSTRLK